MSELANLNIQKSHYAFERLCTLDLFEPKFQKPFFNEFVLKSKDGLRIDKVNEYLLKKGIIGGLELAGLYRELPDCLLLCVTETKTRESIERLVIELGELW